MAGCRAAGNIEQDHWLVPIEDRRSRGKGEVREGMLESFSLGSYLLPVDFMGRLYRNGKARMHSGLKDVFERLGSSEEYWVARLKKMLNSRDLRGSFFGSTRESVQQIGGHRGRRTANLCPQPPG